MARRSIRSLVTAVVAAAFGLNSHAQAVETPDNLANQPPTDLTQADVWSTIDRLNADNPTAYLKVKVAQEAGRSELVAAIVQAAATAESPDAVADAVQAAILRVGGLNGRNIIPLEELLAALRALGLPEDIITATINAYSVEVAEAVAAGVISAPLAAAILTQGGSSSLYG